MFCTGHVLARISGIFCLHRITTGSEITTNGISGLRLCHSGCVDNNHSGGSRTIDKHVSAVILPPILMLYLSRTSSGFLLDPFVVLGGTEEMVSLSVLFLAGLSLSALSL